MMCKLKFQNFPEDVKSFLVFWMNGCFQTLNIICESLQRAEHIFTSVFILITSFICIGPSLQMGYFEFSISAPFDCYDVSTQTHVPCFWQILMLHGYRQNANSCREKSGAFRKLTKKMIDPVFISAPLVVPACPESSGEQPGEWHFFVLTYL